MQGGKIKHWNHEKGYGFIDVDDQDEDVFFHISKVSLAEPIAVGRRVYFTSSRNDKNQLRATKVTSAVLSIEPDTAPNTPRQMPNNSKRDNHSRLSNRNHQNTRQNSSRNKRSLGSTLFSLIAIIAVAEDFKLVIGSGQMIPGFEDGIKGMKAGEEKIIDVTFPEDYQAENLAGKEAQFKINVKLVEKPKLPEIDEEFLELFGVTEGGVDKLKEDVRKNMEREIKNAARSQVKQATFDALLEKNEFDVPSAMLEQEIERQRNMMMQRFSQQFGASADSFDKDMLPNELFEEQALRAARLGIIVARVIDTEGLEVDQERVETFIKEAAENYEDPAEVIEYYTNDKQQRANIESVVLEDQVVDYLISQGKVTDKEVSYQDLLAAQQQQQQGM